MSSSSSLYTILADVYDSTNHALRMVLNYIHTHASNTEGGQLDWDSVWSDAVHSHASDAEGGTLDHGTALTGLTDDDHTQYQKESLLTTAGDMPYATSNSVWARLALGTQNYVLRAGASAPEWASIVGPTVVRKTADETVSNSTTLQNDDVLKLAVAANEVWDIYMVLRFITTSSDHMKIAWTIPTAASMVSINLAEGTTPGTEVDATTEVTNITANGANQFIKYHYQYRGGANAGTAQFQWAQNEAKVYDTKVLANSVLICTKLS